MQTSVDWLHLLPGITGAALIAAGALLRPRRTSRKRRRRTTPRRSWTLPAPALRWAGAGLLALVVALGGVSMSRQFLTERFLDDARTALADDQPQEALTAADRALRLDADSLQAHYLKAAALARFGDAKGAEQVLQRRHRARAARLPDLRADRRPARAPEDIAPERAYTEASRLNPRDLTAPSARRA